MDEDQLYVVTPPHRPPRRVPDAVSGEWLAEKLDQIPTRKDNVPGSVARDGNRRLPCAVPRVVVREGLGARQHQIGISVKQPTDLFEGDRGVAERPDHTCDEQNTQ
jgi:hypothetical protein